MAIRPPPARPSPDSGGDAAAAAVIAHSPRGRMRRFMHWMPTFFWVLIVYMFICLVTADVRNPIVPWFRMTWIEPVYLYAGFTGMWELQRVADVGTKNLKEVYAMLAMLFIFALLYVVALVIAGLAAGGLLPQNYMAWFSSSEFFILTAFSAAQTISAIWINNKTALRDFGSH